MRPTGRSSSTIIGESSADTLKARAASWRGNQQNRGHLQHRRRPRGTDDRGPSTCFSPSTEEWRGIAAAISQQARLLDAGRPLRRTDHFPRPVAPNFGRKVSLTVGHQSRGGAYLHLYAAADLAHAHLTLVGRQTAPVDPGAKPRPVEQSFGVAGVPYFRDLQVQTLVTSSRPAQRNLGSQFALTTLTVLLTPGPSTKPTSNVYLARYLGFPIIEGQDLTVLQRRSASRRLRPRSGARHPAAASTLMTTSVTRWNCAPIHPGRASLLGAVRAGRVFNWPTPGQPRIRRPARLPAASRHLLGEGCRYPPSPPGGAGEARPRPKVSARLRELVISRLPRWYQRRDLRRPARPRPVDRPQRIEVIRLRRPELSPEAVAGSPPGRVVQRRKP